MRVAQKFAGYSLAEADNLRKACLPAGSRILTRSRGYVPIESLMSMGDRRVHTIDTVTSDSRHEPVDDVWSVGVRAVYRITTRTGHTIEATGEHPFLIDDRWVELRNIRPGDLIGVAGRTVTDGGAELAWHEIELAANEAGSWRLDADTTLLDRIVNAPRDEVERFIGLYFCADGWADEAGCHVGATSLEVCQALKRMLLRFGVVSNLHHVPDDGRHWTLSIAGEGHAKEFARLVEPHLTTIKYSKVRRWMYEQSTFTTLLVHRDTLDALHCSDRLDDPRTGDLRWDTVASVEYSRDVECFDFRMANPDRPYAIVEDFLVHNCGKKIRELMAKERDAFEAGVERTGYGEDLGPMLFDIIEKFADYAFNKSHTFGYGLVTYQTAYLKAHYPVEYIASLLTSVKNNLDKAATYLSDCRSMGIKVLPPDVNRSMSNFGALSPDELPPGVTLAVGSPGAITFGLSAVRNVGEGLVELLIAERDENGQFTSFHDFVERVPEPVLNKRTIESLIKGGAFDNLGHPRRGLLTVFEHIIDTTVKRRREREKGVMSLFGDWGDDGGGERAGARSDDGFDERTEIPDLAFDKTEQLRYEKEMLGLYVSDHPLFGVEAAMRRKVEHSVLDLQTMDDGANVVVGGVITNLARKFTKKGDQMAIFLLEDLDASIEVTIFPRTLAEQGHKLEDDQIVAVTGRLDRRDESRFGLIGQTITVLAGLGDGPAAPLRLRLPSAALDELKIQRLKRILREHPGDSVVMVDIGQGKVLKLADEFRVDLDRSVGELRMAFGHEAVLL